MATSSSNNRGSWNSKLGFIMAAAGSAIGLGNIWRFPTEAASNGGGAFLIVYLFCCFLIGFPIMVAEFSIGRSTQKNPVGAFRTLSKNKFFPLVGIWGVICGIMILSFYTILAGWTFSHAFAEIFTFMDMPGVAATLSDTGDGYTNAFFAVLFMIATISIVRGGVSDGIERATKLMMPLLVIILLILAIFVMFQPGASEGLKAYLNPDFSLINSDVILAALGQAFFSLSLGMGTLIAYGSYLNKKVNVVEAAGYITVFDIGVAFLSGLLILPAISLAQSQGVEVYDAAGALIAGPALIFQVLPQLFSQMGGLIGVLFGFSFFAVLSLAALTSTISLLEVPTSYIIDEYHVTRKKAATSVGLFILLITLIISFNVGLIDVIDFVFSVIGLPLGGLLICIFIGYFWKTQKALQEVRHGYDNVQNTLFARIWPVLIKYVCPLIIILVLVQSIF